MEKLSGFVAYPASPYQLTLLIQTALDAVNKRGGNRFAGWQENDIAGKPLTAPILQSIHDSKVVVADITRLNFNVTYEIGYAIGRGKRAYLIRNKEFKGDDDVITKVGIFDTLGYETYNSEKDLADLLADIHDASALNVANPQNRAAPVYVLETPARSGIMTHLIARVKKARLQYRSFVPAEEARLSAIDAIFHVASSFGVVVPLLSSAMEGFEIHNLRAAFIAGLSHGLDRHTLILQDQDGPIPLDIRDFAKTYRHPSDIDAHIHGFSLDVYETTQSQSDLALPVGNFLSQIVVGDPMAENEFQTLGAYYLQTDEFGRAIRGEVNLVVGRKGTGKTALFSQVRNKKRENRDNVVVDLKPEGYQLLKLKEEVLDYLSAGAKAHLVVAFWEYLLYLEIAHKLLEKDRVPHLRDPNLFEPYKRLEALYEDTPNVSEGDFSERLLALSQDIAQRYRTEHTEETDVRLMSGQITQLLHAKPIKDLQTAISSYLRHKDEVWVLFDNLDKGWSTNGLAHGDIEILRCLIDAARKIERQIRRDSREFHVIVFVRNDVYQLLMEKTADFGKETRASLDWDDDELLREMLRKRLVQNKLPDADFHQLWSRVCVSHYLGEETSQYFIDRSLMRPRNVLKIFNACRGFAVNHQHDRIEEDDIERGVKAYSNDLLIDADHELTDIEPKAQKLIYQFLGERSEFTADDLAVLLELNGIDVEARNRIVDFLLYYGFLGIRYSEEDTQYIYHVGYDMEILKTRITKNRSSIRYVLNPAFWPALEIRPN